MMRMGCEVRWVSGQGQVRVMTVVAKMDHLRVKIMVCVPVKIDKFDRMLRKRVMKVVLMRL